MRKLILATLVLPLVLGLLVVSALTPSAPDATYACATDDAGNPLAAAAPGAPNQGTTLQRQRANAATWVSTGASMGVPSSGQLVGLMVILVESGALNLASRRVPESMQYPNDGVAAGNLDSVGLAQQRASWGTVAERMHPPTSATLFYRALLAVPNWERLDAGVAAQRVQRSAYPSRYAEKIEEAGELLAAVGGPASAGAAGSAEALDAASVAECSTDGEVDAAGEDGESVEQTGYTVGGTPWTRVQVQGKWLDSDTASRITAGLGDAYRLNQGSWSTAVSASAGTHAGSGVADLTPIGIGWIDAESRLRRAGLIAWFRNWPGNLHIHLVNAHVDGLSPSALNQVSAWNRGEDGLGSTPGR